MGTIAPAGWTQADALRLGRVIRALAAAGLIDECYIVVRAPGGHEREDGHDVRPPRAPRRPPEAGARGSARQP
jgi:hypothetical protein